MSNDRPALEYAPGLDGLRGFCLIAVFFYHAPYAWAGGAFFSVSTFFTLSGYLITTLLLAELDRHGTVDLTAFWERRMRRMGPALWLGVGATLVTSPLWLDEPIQEMLGLDGLSAVLFYSNWHFMSPEYAYSKLFSDPSPLQHCWSLAIEAQYYLVIPLVLELVARRSDRRGLALWLLALITASVGVGWIAVSGQEATYRGYYGTDVRAAEILVGALLAVAVDAGWVLPRTLSRSSATLIGSVGLAGMLFGWHYASVEAQWLYRGGFAVYAVFSAAVIVAILAVENPVRSLLSSPWLCWLGRVSYGAYVFHWPIFLLLSAERTGLQHDLLFALRVGVTLAVAGLSYAFLENPVRRRQWPKARRSFGAVVAAAVAASAVAVVVTDPSMVRRADDLVPRPVDRALSFAVFGDSVALNLAPSLGSWLQSHGMDYVVGHQKLGCALIDRGTKFFGGVWADIPERCRNLRESWRVTASSHRPDVAIVLLGTWDVRDRRITVLDDARAPGDPVFDRELRKAARETVETFRAEGVKVVWLTCPLVRFPEKDGEDPSVAEITSDPARIRRFNEIVREVAAEFPEDVFVVDFADYLDGYPGGPFEPTIRSDGVHFTRIGRKKMAIWLGPEIVRAAFDLVAPDRGA